MLHRLLVGNWEKCKRKHRVQSFKNYLALMCNETGF